MEIMLKATPKKVPHTPIRDHYWYDSHTQETLHGRGTVMKFKFIPELHRCIPYVENQTETKTTTNFDEISKWVNSHPFEIMSFSENYHISINVPNEQSEDVINSLLQKRILFEER